MAVRAASSRRSERGGAAVAGASRCRTARPCAARVRAPTVAAQVQKFAAAVTGANRGIGLEFVRQLTSRPGGACVVAGVRDPGASGELRELAAQLAEQGGSSQLHLVELDVTDPASVEAWAARTTEICGGHVDLLLNNAGTTGTDGYSKWCVLLTALRGCRASTRPAAHPVALPPALDGGACDALTNNVHAGRSRTSTVTRARSRRS